MSGGYNLKSEFNRATQAKDNPIVFKPFVYLAGLEKTISQPI